MEARPGTGNGTKWHIYKVFVSDVRWRGAPPKEKLNANGEKSMTLTWTETDTDPK